MKRFTALVFAFLMLVSFPGVSRGDWLGGWIDQQTSSGPNYYQDEKRGYFSMGSMSLRYYRPSGTYPFTVSLPSISLGCGGIDVLGGGFGFLSPDQLVQLAQSVLTAAAFYAFKMALSTISPQISNHLQDAINAMNQLNSIQLDACKAGKALAVTLLPERVTKESKKQAWTEFLQESGISNLWTDARKKIEEGNTGNGEKLKDAMAGCPADVKEILSNLSGHNSLLEYAYNKLGLSSVLGSDGLKVLRGIAGDVEIRWNSSGNDVAVLYHPPCPQNVSNPRLYGVFVSGGDIYAMDSSFSCQQVHIDPSQSFNEKIRQKMEEIYQKFLNGNSPEGTDLGIVRTIPGAYPILLEAAKIGETMWIGSFSNFAARSWAYGFMVNLLRICSNTVRQLEAAVPEKLTKAEKENCKAYVIASELEAKIKKWEKSILSLAGSFRGEYIASLKEVKLILDQALGVAEINRIILSKFGSFRPWF